MMAVIPNAKCFTASMSWSRMQRSGRPASSRSQRLVIMLVALMAMLQLGAAVPTTQICGLAAVNFTTANELMPSKGLHIPATGPICGPGSCCHADWERQLAADLRLSTERYLREQVQRVASTLDARGARFDALFRDMMEQSKRDFDEMFRKTYGMIYVQNSAVFEDLFRELENYYATGGVKLSDMLHHFFTILYQRMFVVINGQYQIDDKYLDCVGDHMAVLQPFDDIPSKLTIQLRKAFVATRVFYKSLVAGSRVAGTMVDQMAQLLRSQECSAELMRMHHCGTCTSGASGPSVLACAQYCFAAYSHCLRNFIALSAEWDRYVDAIDKVSDRLLGPFNIELVVEPINIKISEAIMNFQDGGAKVSEKVFKMCGTPRPSARQRRELTEDHLATRLRRHDSVDDGGGDEEEEEDDDGDGDEDIMDEEDDIDYSPQPQPPAAAEIASAANTRNKANKGEILLKRYKFASNGSRNDKRKHKKTPSREDTLENVVTEIKAKIKEFRQFWRFLPYHFCNMHSNNVERESSDHCWTGTEVGEFRNSSVKRDSSPLPALVQKQIEILESITHVLKDAHQGNDVDFPNEQTTIIQTQAPISYNEDTHSGDGPIDNDDEDARQFSGDGDNGGGGGGGGGDDDDEYSTSHPAVVITPEPKVKLASTEPTTSTATPPVTIDEGDVDNDDDNEILHTGSNDDAQKTSGGGTVSGSELRKALFQFLMPIVMVWFGSTFTSDFL